MDRTPGFLQKYGAHHRQQGWEVKLYTNRTCSIKHIHPPAISSQSQNKAAPGYRPCAGIRRLVISGVHHIDIQKGLVVRGLANCPSSANTVCRLIMRYATPVREAVTFDFYVEPLKIERDFMYYNC